MPKRSRIFDAKAIRACFLPEEGQLWSKVDYWSQEPTIQCHYGLVLKQPGAAEVAEQFKKKIKLYTYVQDATKGKCDYDMAKIVVLAKSYGQMVKSAARGARVAVADMQQIFDEFDRVCGYIPGVARTAEALAAQRGWVRTLLGYKRHFNQWTFKPYWDEEQRKFIKDDRGFTREEAEKRFPGHQIIRAHVRKAYNALIQGTAAGQAKKAIIEINRAIGLPCLPVHDEVNKSVADEKESRLHQEIMENCVPLLLPVQTDRDLGPTWV